MRKLLIKQKYFSLGEKFYVRDEFENPVYEIQGSFLKIPKTFEIYQDGALAVVISKKIFSFLPTFHVEMYGREVLTIKKEFTFFKPSYVVEGEGIQIKGDFWDMDFSLYKHGELIGEIHKQWFTFRDTYELAIHEQEEELLFLSVVVAIDYVKQMEKNSASVGSYD